MRLRREELYFRPSKYNCPNSLDIFAHVAPLARADVIVQEKAEELTLPKGNVTGLSLQSIHRASGQAEPPSRPEVQVRRPGHPAPEDAPLSSASTETGITRAHAWAGKAATETQVVTIHGTLAPAGICERALRFSTES